MNVLALLPHPEAGASGRYRVHQFAPALAQRGIALTVRSFHDAESFARLYRPGHVIAKALDWRRAFRRRREQIADADAFDVVFVHRELWPMRGLALERALVARNPRLLFDLDDAVWLPNVSPANRAFAILKDPAKSAWLAAHARTVTAGNHALQAWAAAAVDGRGTAHYVPTAVDTETWSPRTSASGRRGGEVVLGWIGSHTTVSYLDLLAGVLDRLARRFPGLSLRVIGAAWSHPTLRVECVPWSTQSEVAALDGTDVGLAPLPDDAWSRGKCGLKVIQCMALAKPVVAARVGAHPEIVGDAGLLAGNEVEWEAALAGLIEDPARRAALGQAGRARVRERFSVNAVAPLLAAALAEAREAR